MLPNEFDKLISPLMRGAYLFYGPEEYLKQYYKKKLKKTLIGDESLEGFNYSLLSDLSELASQIDILPVMNDRRLVEITDIKFSKLSQDALSELCELCAGAASQETVLLFYTRGDEFSGEKYSGSGGQRSKEYFKKLSQAINTVEFAKQTPARLSAWLGKHFAANHVVASPETCAEMVERCGTDMNTLANETEKLCAYMRAQGRDRLDSQILKNVSIPNDDIGAFDFVNAILDRNTSKAFEIFSEMKKRKTEPVEIAASVSRVIHELINVKTLSDCGRNAAEISQITSLKPYPVKQRLASASKRTREELYAAARACLETDIKLKSRCADRYIAIEELIFELGRAIPSRA